MSVTSINSRGIGLHDIEQSTRMTTNVGVIGAGVGGLHLGLFLQKHDVPVTLYAERTPDEMRTSRLPNTAALWAQTRERERELGVNHWDDIAERWAINHMYIDVAIQPPLHIEADLELGGICVDQRLYTARLLEDFVQRGGHVVYGRIAVEALELLSQLHDLVIVSSGRGSMTELFERVETPFSEPQRFLCTGIYEGLSLPDPPGLQIGVAPGSGELFQLPYITFGGQLCTLFFEVIPGGACDPLMSVRYDQNPDSFEKTVLEVLGNAFPTVRERVDESKFKLHRPQDVLQGAITPTVRRGYATLKNGRHVLALGDVHVAHDPIMGQGANQASNAAFMVGQAILEDDLNFDEMWFSRTEARMWEWNQNPFRWNNYMLQVPLPMNMIKLLMAAGRDKRVANEFAKNFAYPDRQWNLLATTHRTETFLRRYGHDPSTLNPFATPPSDGAPPSDGRTGSTAEQVELKIQTKQGESSVATKQGESSMATVQADERARDLASAPRKMLIGGEWIEASSGSTLDLFNPATGDVLAKMPSGGPIDVDRAVKAARAAFVGDWSKTTASDRGKMLWRLGDLIDQNMQEIAELDALDNGMPVGVASAFAMLAAETCRYMAGWATKIEGNTLDPSVPYTPGAEYHAYTLREPLGVVGAIIPWNYPALAACWKLAPAIATGNTVVLKPAEQACLSVLRVGELALEAGFPPGVVNIVTGLGETAGAAIAAHQDIDKITFTGSNETGKLIVRAAADTNLKKVSLELGGKSPNVVFKDAQVEGAIPGLANAIFFNQGQNCAAGSRLYVERPVFDSVIEGLSQAAKQIKVGPGLDPSTELGPLVSKEQLDRVLGYLDSGYQAGAKASAGGTRLEGNGYENGYFLQPTVLVDTRQDMKVIQEEIFGPVVAAIPFDTPEEVVPLANDTIYGLAAGVWTSDVSKAHRIARQLKAGTVWINTYNIFDATMPFGGYKQSGWGKELGQDAIHEFTQLKTVCVGI